MTRSYCVVIPTYDRYLSVVRAIASCFSQTVQPEEVVVIDDASPDARYEWLEEVVDDKRLTYLRLPTNSRSRLGVGYANGAVRNHGLAYLDGIGFDGWIAFLDDDDEWVADKAQRQLEAVETFGDCRLVCSNAANRLPDGTVTGRHHPEHGEHIGSNVYDVTETFGHVNPVVNSSAMMTTALRTKIGLQKPASLWEDFDYWKRAASFTRVLRVDDPLVFYTVGNDKAYST